MAGWQKGIGRLGMATLAIVGCLIGGSASALGAKSERVYVADYGGKVEKMTLTGGVKVLSDDPELGNPAGITVGKGDKLLVSDIGVGSQAILKVNPDNGNVSTVTDSNKLVYPFDLAQNRKGQIYVADADAGPGESGAVFRVDPDSGKVKTIAEGPPLDNAWGLALGRHHKLYLADGKGAIFKVNIKTGAVRAIAKGRPLVNPIGLEKGPHGKLYATDYSAGPDHTGAVFRINPKNGNVQTIRKGPPLDEMFGIDFDSSGRMWFPAAPDTDDDYDVWKMKTSGAGLHGFVSLEFVNPLGVAVG